MKRIITHVFALLLVATLPFSACKKEDAPKPTNNTNTNNTSTASLCTPSKSKTDGNLNYEITYSNNRIIEIKNYDFQGNYEGYTNFEYNNSGKLVKIQKFGTDNKNFQYSNLSYNAGGQLIKELFYVKNTVGVFTIDHYYSLEYNNNRVSKISTYNIVNDTESELVSYANITNDANGNVIKAQEYDPNDKLLSTKEYQYDDKKNIQNGFVPDALSTAYNKVNNVSKYTNKEEDEFPLEDTYTAVFTYNSNGNVTKETRTYIDSRVEVIDYEYSCK